MEREPFRRAILPDARLKASRSTDRGRRCDRQQNRCQLHRAKSAM
jgi:hypothetical protein